jgi:hypothetical protein
LELYECEISLKKVRAYRDSAELLLFVKPKINRPKRTEQDNPINCWGIRFSGLSAVEKSSLRVLSPHLTMLHVEWFNSLILDKTKSSLQATDPVKPLSLPPPKRLSVQTSVAEEIEEKWSLMPTETREKVIESIRSEKAKFTAQNPLSVEEIKRTLSITDTLSLLEERWGDVSSKEQINLPVDMTQTQSEILNSAHQDETLCLYFQTGQFDQTILSSNLPKALHGGWIDSFPPKSMASDDQEKAVKRAELNEGIWVRLLLESSHWTPSVVLSLHGDMGRLSVNANLECYGISQLLDRAQTTKHLNDDAHQLEVSFEWIDDYYHRNLGDFGEETQSRESTMPLADLLHLSSNEQGPSICFESLLLVSRSLRDLEGEVALISSLKRLSLSDTKPTADGGLGYFTDFVQFKYPPALTTGSEKALTGHRFIRLCLPQLGPFLQKMLMYVQADKLVWELIIEGISRSITPNKDHGDLLSFYLGETNDVFATRLDQGLEFSSDLSYSCHVGVVTIDGGTLLDELNLPSLGGGALRQLEKTIETISQSTEEVL